jgi:hypothetical protein
MQANGRLTLRRESALETPLDEIAIQAAEQLLRAITAQVQVRKVVHGSQLSTLPSLRS